MIRLLATLTTGLLLILLSGCEQKVPQAPQIQCSDYNKLTDKNAKKELEKRCPAVVGTENIQKLNNSKDMLSELNELPE